MKKTCTALMDVLTTLNNAGIRTRAALMEDQELYAALWYAVDQFVAFALRSKTGKKNEQGEVTCGNIGKIEKLVQFGITTKEDIHADCVVKIMSKLDLVLQQFPVEKQHNYCYSICNHLVNDQFRKLPPKEVEVVYLQDTVKSRRTSGEEAYAYEDVIGDYAFDGETQYVQKETLCELHTLLQEKRDAARLEEREAVIREMQLLAKKPAEILVHMACAHLGLKPRALAARIVEKGAEVTYAEILMAVAKKVGLDMEQLRALVKDSRLTEQAVKADTCDAAVVASQVSRLVYRAGQKLGK